MRACSFLVPKVILTAEAHDTAVMWLCGVKKSRKAFPKIRSCCRDDYEYSYAVEVAWGIWVSSRLSRTDKVSTLPQIYNYTTTVINHRPQQAIKRPLHHIFSKRTQIAS
jgi:hypothetical protein